MERELPKCPSTPSPSKPLEIFSGWVTPESARPSKINTSEISPGTPYNSLPSPSSLAKQAKFSEFPVESHVRAHSLPTPLTVGTGRKVREQVDSLEPSTRSKSLTAALRAVANGTPESLHLPCSSKTLLISEEGVELKGGSDITDTIVAPKDIPTTPHQYTKSTFSNYSDSEDEIQIIKVTDLHEIPQTKLKNPFVDNSPSHHHHRRPQRHDLDLSTCMEKINYRTGERRVEKLSAEQQRFKPRKLEFTLDVKTPVRVNYNVTNKYIGSSIGKSFMMGEPQAKSSPGFHIFDDGEALL